MNPFETKKWFIVMKEDINQREQYARNWCVRINNLFVPKYLIKRYGIDGACMLVAYTKLIKPVLQKSMPDVQDADWGDSTVPSLHSVLENGHFLGKAKKVTGTNIDLPRTIIIRFKSRYWRNLYLKNKRKFLPQPSKEDQDKYNFQYYFVNPDLTKKNHSFLMTIKKDSRIRAAWTIDGKFRFILHSNPNKTYYAVDTLASIDEIIAKDQAVQVDRDFSASKSGPDSPGSTPTPSNTTSATIPSASTNAVVNTLPPNTSDNLDFPDLGGARPKHKQLGPVWKTAGARRSTPKKKKSKGGPAGVATRSSASASSGVSAGRPVNGPEASNVVTAAAPAQDATDRDLLSGGGAMALDTDGPGSVLLKLLPTDEDLDRNLFQEKNFVDY